MSTGKFLSTYEGPCDERENDELVVAPVVAPRPQRGEAPREERAEQGAQEHHVVHDVIIGHRVWRVEERRTANLARLSSVESIQKSVWRKPFSRSRTVNEALKREGADTDLIVTVRVRRYKSLQ